MDQRSSLKILILIVIMTHDYLKCCNVSLLIYRGLCGWIHVDKKKDGSTNKYGH